MGAGSGATTTHCDMPQSMALWYRRPNSNLATCTPCHSGGPHATQSNRPLTIESFRATLPDGCTCKEFVEHGTKFKTLNDGMPTPHRDMPKKIPYPTQCNALCGQEYVGAKSRFAINFKNALLHFMKVNGGFRGLLKMDLVLLVAVSAPPRTQRRLFIYLPSGIGKPQDVDIIRLQLEGPDNPNNVDIHLTFEHELFIQSRLEHPPSLGSSEPALKHQLSDEFIHEILSPAPRVRFVRLVQLNNHWPESDLCIITGVSGVLDAITVSPASHIVAAPSASPESPESPDAFDFFSAFDDDDGGGEDDGRLTKQTCGDLACI